MFDARMLITRRVARAVVAALAFTLASVAVARADADPCSPTAAYDALSSARRSRALVLDFLRFQRNLDADVAYVDELARLDPDATPTRHVYVAPGFEGRELGDFDVCTDHGLQRAKLLQARLALTVGFDDPSGVSLRLSVMRGEDITRYGFGNGKATRFDTGDGAWGFGQTLWAARIGSSRWFEAVFALAGSESESITATPQGVTLIKPTNDASVLSRGSVAYWLGAHSRALGVGVGALVQGELVELATVSLDPIALGKRPFFAAGAATFLREERQGVTSLSLTYASGDSLVMPGRDRDGNVASYDAIAWGWSLLGEASMEWNTPRIRHARAELDGFIRAGVVPKLFAFTAGLDWHLYADATMFNSAFMARLVDRSGVVGGGIGLRGIQGLRVGSVVFDVSGAVNRPETLALIPQAVDHPELRMQMFFRFGW